MSSRKKIDILQEVLTSDGTDQFPGIDELNRFLLQPPAQGGNQPRQKKGSRADNRKKKKKTHYLSQETLERLNRTLPEIRKILPEGIRNRISRSRLVDSSLQLLLREFETRGERSLLVRHLLNGAD